MADLIDPNYLVDLILDYLGQAKIIDPLDYNTKQNVDFNRNVTVIMNNCAITGLTNFKRVSEKTKLEKLDNGKYSFNCDIEISNLEMSVNFDAKLGIPRYRWHPTNKTGIVSLESCTFNIEFVMDIQEKNFNGTNIKFIQRSPVICTCTGFGFPINWIMDKLFNSNMEQYYLDHQDEIEQEVKERVNNYFRNTFDLFSNLINSRPELKIFTSKLNAKFIGKILNKFGI